MKAYCGQTREPKLVRLLQERGVGECTVRGELKSRKRSPWFYDNGAYRDWQGGKDFNAVQFTRDCRRMRMDIERGAARPDFVVMPDRVAAGPASLEFSSTFVLECAGLPCYLALQDGMTEEHLVKALAWFAEGGTDVRGLFVGGTTEWKICTARSWVRFAHQRELALHIGRVGTPDRVAWAVSIGADSIDSCLPIMFTSVHLHPFLAAIAA